ncbi:MAG: F0F1 ATP synthase subunit delta [Candidatus Omnitrophota bacterium]|nr:MAG: F0F1 ATP synthase subunit delta [Candidatus Omnitrophota bacterium]
MEIKDIIRLILIQVGTFAALIIALRLLFYQHLNSALRRLKKLQEEALIKEENLRDELERAKQERIAEVERGKREAKALIEKAKKEVEVIRSKTEDRAKEERRKTLLYGKEEVEKLRQNLLADIEKQAVGLSVEMIKYVFTEKGRDILQHQLAEELIEEMAALDKRNFSVKANKVKVITSFPLSKEEKLKLKKILTAKIGSDVVLTEEVDQDLISGIIVRIGEFVIDGSLQNKIQKVIPFIKGKK